jgi:hypothetical protein
MVVARVRKPENKEYMLWVAPENVIGGKVTPELIDAFLVLRGTKRAVDK